MSAREEAEAVLAALLNASYHEDRIDIVGAAISRWRDVALYLADCTAATAEYEGTLKSASESRRRRHISLCEKATALISGKECLSAVSTPRAVIDRLESVRQQLQRR